MRELYLASLDGDKAQEPKWIEIQRLAFSPDPEEADEALAHNIRAVAQGAVRMPIVRKAIADLDVMVGGKKIKAGETVILDLVGFRILLCGSPKRSCAN